MKCPLKDSTVFVNITEVTNPEAENKAILEHLLEDYSPQQLAEMLLHSLSEAQRMQLLDDIEVDYRRMNEECVNNF